MSKSEWKAMRREQGFYVEDGSVICDQCGLELDADDIVLCKKCSK